MGGTEKVAQHFEYNFSLQRCHNKSVSSSQCYLSVSKGTVASFSSWNVCWHIAVPAECAGAELGWAFSRARRSDWWHQIWSTSAEFVHSPCNECCYQCCRFLTHRDSWGFYTWKRCMSSLPFTGSKVDFVEMYSCLHWQKAYRIQTLCCVTNNHFLLQYQNNSMSKVRKLIQEYITENLLVSSMIYKLLGFICCCQDSNHPPKVSDTSAPHAVVLHDFPAGK